ncbi:site-specific DNA-methyltransferase [Paracoccus litorisediminis]|uniref:Methyltransferase n=1 Tax=Paracoccus litorisediminis TaxID=2006130 RepID=A0A844HUS9_9RHOB|nr:site-specific DNA-methyltransferase [Paracoccus litorisediminis]MTH62097.1 DNA modification methylase [Paracoccus litorisediminis]
MKIEMISPAALVPYARNARTHPEWQIAQIAASIQEFGFTNPILIGADQTIIAGHGRLAGALRLGLDRVPCIRLKHLSDAQRRALVIADNRIAESAGWDEDLLSAELRLLEDDGFDLDVLGFSDEELGKLLDYLPDDDSPAPGVGDPDHVPDAPLIHVSGLGDIWQLGPHRLICGDSTSLEAVQALCPGEEIDACWTDPPYNVNYEGSAGKIANDNMEASEFRRFLASAFSVAAAVMKPGAPIYVAHADTEGLNFRRAFADAGFKLSGCLVWVKPSLVLGRSDYQWRHEPILYGWKRGAAHQWFGGRANTTVIEHENELIRVQSDGSVHVRVGAQEVVIEGQNLTMRAVDQSVIRYAKPARNAEHPTMKPVGLVADMLENSSKAGDLVLDLFGGSGSTLIACETLGRRARLVELDPKFADVIVRRWQDFTGKAATLEATGQSFDTIRVLKERGAAA